ncbi:hypothetical protein KZO01_24760 [Kurthia zopfii]|uniref:Uncharacterized protein n=1 Tax=Kurthia zopfii TaxID=1650 RepID=A0A8B4Q510_9BACL|nr:hypothetical protein [Kurthia zopfii]PWI21246.1 hypothetical protein DF281_13205 [Kurthia zopfii]TDR33828.1 hypothetical protein DFR61_1479 [Kurthia zopfii]GEK32167.1 hypothetical protein KZO01_24760 [Kurthia zopfii]STX08887.1 Uncharacterised protein [Kurthia zopfii]
MAKITPIIIATVCSITLFLTSSGKVVASSDRPLITGNISSIFKYKFNKNEPFEAIVTTTSNKKIKLIIEKNKVFYTNYIYESVWDYKLAENLTIKLASENKIKIKKGKFYSKNKLFSGKIKTKNTLVRPLSGKAYFYLKGTIKKGVLISGTEYMIDSNSVWPG